MISMGYTKEVLAYTFLHLLGGGFAGRRGQDLHLGGRSLDLLSEQRVD